MKCASRGQNQIYSGFAEAEYLRHRQSTIFFCQSAAGGGCVGRLWRDDAALRMGRLRAAALRVLTEERIFRNCILADLRSAGSHCENSGSSDGSGASARSDRVKSEVFRDRSASAGGDTRYFSRCLIFWCFWIKPKAQKKNFERRKIFRSILREASRPSIRRFLRGADLPPFGNKRWRQKCPQGTSVGIGRRFSLSGHKRLRCCGAKDCTASTVAARQSPQAASALACCPSFCTPAPGARTAVRSDSSSGAMRRLLCASRNGNYSFASAHVRPLVFRRDGCLSSGSS